LPKGDLDAVGLLKRSRQLGEEERVETMLEERGLIVQIVGLVSRQLLNDLFQTSDD